MFNNNVRMQYACRINIGLQPYRNL